MNGVTGRRIYCWNADVKLKQKRFCINSCNSVSFYPMVAAQRIGEEYELKIDKAPQNVDSAPTQGRRWRACAS